MFRESPVAVTISKTIYLDIQYEIAYKETKSSCKESFFGRTKNLQRTPNSFLAGFFVNPLRVSPQDLPKASL